MDEERFDHLSRLLARGATRRGMAGALAVVLSALPAAARPRRRNGKRKDRRRDNGEDQERKRARQRGKTRPAPVGAEIACCTTGACAIGPGKNLQKCCFQEQDLTGRDFRGANLRGANLDKTCLVDAVMIDARLGGTNIGTAIFCRTTMPGGAENNSGCDNGTPCCPTCDAANSCDADEICCKGRCIPGSCCDNGAQSTCDDGQRCCGNTCVAGACCAASDCPNEICQRRSCRDNQCAYTPVFGEPGPRCQTICCQDAQGDSVCCGAGVAVCGSNGRCGCSRDADCDDENACTIDNCVDGECFHVPKTCDDGVDCTDDTCDPDVGCVNTPNADLCVAPDNCSTARCDPTDGCVQEPIDCDDGNACTIDFCDPVAGVCKHTPVQNLCNDNLQCTDDFCVPDPEVPNEFECVFETDLDNCGILSSCQYVICAVGFDCANPISDDTLCPPSVSDCLVPKCRGALGCGFEDICNAAHPDCNGSDDCSCNTVVNRCVPSGPL